MNFEPFSIFTQLLPDSDCYLCKQSVANSHLLPSLICNNCHNRLPILKNACPICAMPLTNQNQLTSSNFACGECLKKAPIYSKAVSAFHYEPPISDFIIGLKYNAKHLLTPLLSHYLITAIKQNYQSTELPQILIPVPLHSKKIRLRGFNQAQIIAESLAKALKLPVLINSVARVKYTKAQSALNAKQRQINLKAAFIVKDTALIKTKRIAIVDDVVTTGATANELSLQLLLAGASKVDVWSVARAFSL